MPRASTAVQVASIEEYLRGLSQEGDPEKLLHAAMEVIGRLSARLDAQLRARYSPKSEKLDPAQLQLVLAELAREQGLAESAAETTAADAPSTVAPDEPAASATTIPAVARCPLRCRARSSGGARPLQGDRRGPRGAGVQLRRQQAGDSDRGPARVARARRGVFTMTDPAVHSADLGVHDADLRVHDGPIRAFTMGRFPQVRCETTMRTRTSVERSY